MSERPPLWWERRGVAVLLALAFAVPLLWPEVPPLTDLPGHMARYHVALDGGATPALARAFGYQWRLIGNLGVDLALMPLGAVFGVESATRIVVALIPVLTAAAMLVLSRVVHGRIAPTALFALPLALCWPLQLGFVNFCLAMALVLWLIAGWIALAQRPGLRAAVAVPASWLVWIAHGFAWGLAGILAFGAELALRRDRGEAWPHALGGAAIHALALATPLLAMLGGGATAASSEGWFGLAKKLAATLSVLRDHWLTLDLASAILLLAIVYLGARDRRLGYAPVLAIPAALLSAAFVATPEVLFGAAFADARVAPYALALALLAIRPPADARLARRLALAGAAFMAVRIGAATASLSLASAAYDRELAVLPAIPRGTAVYALVRHDCDGGWDDRRLDHLPSFAILRRDAFANDQWVMAGQQLLTIRPTGAAPFDHDPSQIATDRACAAGAIDLASAVRRFPRWRYRYLWTIGFPPGRVRDARLALVWRSDTSALYRIVPATAR